MILRNLCKCLVLTASVSSLWANDVVETKVKDIFKVAEPNAVELNGILGESLNLSLRGDVLVSEIDSLVEPFRTRPETRRWDCEFWGKWFTGALLAYDYKPSYYFKARLDKSIADLMATQDENGSITTYQKAHEFKLNETGGFDYKDKISWDLWGRKYTLLGLLDYYARTGDKKVLESAKRHTDYIMQHVGEGKKDIVQIGCWFGCASTSILEPIVLLYRATGEQKYLDYAYWIISRWEKSPIKPDLLNKALKNVDVLDMFYDGKEPLDFNQYHKCGRSKAYEMGSCFEGLVELYRTTGDEIYLKAVLNHARSIRDTEINITGSGSIYEQWAKGKFIQTNDHLRWNEVCVTTTWIKLCGQLLRLTGDVQYADHIEIAMYNALIAHLDSCGESWIGSTPLNGARGRRYNERATRKTCCSTNGIRGLFLAPKFAYMTSKNGVVVNFYEKSNATLSYGDGNVDLVISDVDFIFNDTAKVKLSGIKTDTAKFEIAFRIPRWCESPSVVVNGKETFNATPASYCKIVRNWKNGDEISLTFNSDLKIVKDPAGSDLISLSKGRYILVQDQLYTADFGEPAPLKLEIGKPVWKPVCLKNVHVAVDVLLENGKWRRFIDYSSAGKTFDSVSEIKTWFKQK